MDPGREFNPILFEVLDEEGINRPEVVNVPVERWTGLSNSVAKMIEIEDRLDGLLVISDTMAISKFPGAHHIPQHPTVFLTHPSRYKGLTRYFGDRVKHIYEFSLGIVGPFTLNALIWTVHVVTKNNQPLYPEMIKSYHLAIKNAIQTLNPHSLTRREAQVRLDGVIHIYEDDWEAVSASLKEELPKLLEDRLHAKNFPPFPQFGWSLKHLGQNKKFSQTHDAFGITEYKPFVRVCGRFKCAVHIARDFELPNNTLFWIPPSVCESWDSAPKDIFHVSLIPGLGNVTFLSNQNVFTNAQYYSKLHSSVHRDRFKFFVNTYIVDRLYKRYKNVLERKGKLVPKLAKEKTAQKFSNELSVLLFGLHDVHVRNTKARLEIVWSSDFCQSADNFESINQFIMKAYCDFQIHIEQRDRPLFRNNMLAAVNTTVLWFRQKKWIDCFHSTIADIYSKVEAIEDTENLYDMSPDVLISAECFHLAQIAEYLLRFMILGHMSRANSRLPILLGITQAFFNSGENVDSLSAWPFQHIEYFPNGLKCTETNIFSECFLNLKQPSSQQYFKKYLESLENLKAVHRLTDMYDRSFQWEMSDEMQSFVHEFIKILQIFHCRVHEPSNEHLYNEVSIVFCWRQPIKSNRIIKFMSPKEFLSSLERNPPKSVFVEHGPLFNLYPKLLSNFPRTDRNTLRERISMRIETLINTHGYPFRFSLSLFTENVVLTSANVVTQQDNAFKAWEMGLIDVNICRNPILNSRLKPAGLINIYTRWMIQNHNDRPQQFNYVDVAKVLQSIIDTGYTCFWRRLPPSLTDEIKLYIDNMGGNMAPPPPLNLIDDAEEIHRERTDQSSPIDGNVVNQEQEDPAPGPSNANNHTTSNLMDAGYINYASDSETESGLNDNERLPENHDVETDSESGGYNQRVNFANDESDSDLDQINDVRDPDQDSVVESVGEISTGVDDNVIFGVDDSTDDEASDILRNRINRRSFSNNFIDITEAEVRDITQNLSQENEPVRSPRSARLEPGMVNEDLNEGRMRELIQAENRTNRYHGRSQSKSPSPRTLYQEKD